jgi:poly(3-hydroxybutyrate) depolymerase
MGAEITEITGKGGVVASFSTSTGMGTNTGDAVWYTGDFVMADQILACAVQQLNIDTRQIYTAGCSAGGLQSGAMVYSRSSYLAAAMPNSGGITFAGAFQFDDPSHIPALITTHGGSSDMVVVSFAQTSATEDNDIAAKGGYVVDCNHGGGHCGAPANDIAAQWQFCKDHPFGVSPNPYSSGLPSSFPTYCTIIH